MAFKDEHLELQHLVRELHVLRRHNLRFKAGDRQDDLLLFAEGAVVLIVLERFVRAVLGADANEGDTLFNLLQKAVSKKVLRLPWDDQDEGIRRLKEVRNTILHGNFEQAARQAGAASVADYFGGTFAAEIERLYQIVDFLFRQIDPETGRPTG